MEKKSEPKRVFSSTCRRMCFVLAVGACNTTESFRWRTTVYPVQTVVVGCQLSGFVLKTVEPEMGG